MPLLSFSIDLTRSTEAKSLINKIAHQNPEQKNQLIQDYYRRLLLIESDFYFQCMVKGIPLEKLFLVKSIGDELWYVIEWDDNITPKAEILKIISELIVVLADIAARPIDLFISEREIAWEEEESSGLKVWDNVNHQRIIMYKKVYMDLLYDYYSFSHQRSEFILDKTRMHYHEHEKHVIQSKAHPKDIDNVFLAKIPEIAVSLNLGHPEITGTKIKLSNIRFDPIGVDIDKFFRCASRGMSSMVRVGEKLFEFMASNIDKNKFSIEYQDGGCTRHEWFNYITKNYPEGELKGVLGDYKLYTIPLFAGAVCQKSPYDDDKLDEARNHLIENSFLSDAEPVGEDEHKIYKINKEVWTRFY